MIKKYRPRIYSQFEINSVVFFANMFMFLPLILVFTHLFEFDRHININTFILWVVIVNLVVLVMGTVILALSKDKLKRKVKASYRTEFFYMIFLFVFGLLGTIVLYDYMGGNRAYIANILVVIFAGLTFLTIYLGRTLFKFDYINKK